MSPPLFELLSSNPMNVFIDSAINLVVALATKLSIFLLFAGIILHARRACSFGSVRL
jgi:uncharacterized iron-regulated membrane protein